MYVEQRDLMARLVPCLSQSENPCRSPTSSKLLDTHRVFISSSRHGELNSIEEALLCILDGQTWLSVESCFQYNRGRCPGRYGNTVEIDKSISFLKKMISLVILLLKLYDDRPRKLCVHCELTFGWIIGGALFSHIVHVWRHRARLFSS